MFFKKKEKDDSQKKVDFFSWENLRSFVPLLLLVFAFRWSVGAPYHVPTPSMEPSIKVGDRLLGNHLAYGFKVPFTNLSLVSWASPKRGEIVVFDSQTQPGINMVKRVVATEGDKVQYINNVLYVNGEPQKLTDHNDDRSILEDITDYPDVKMLYRENLTGYEHWVIFDQRRASFISQLSDWPEDGQPYTVPEGHIFASGDNRHNSSDSREWGTVPLNDVYGRAEFVIWSMYSRYDRPGFNFRWSRFFSSLE